jgi:hypothetical protein
VYVFPDVRFKPVPVVTASILLKVPTVNPNDPKKVGTNPPVKDIVPARVSSEFNVMEILPVAIVILLKFIQKQIKSLEDLF